MNREPVDFTTDTWYVCLLLISVELACCVKGEGRDARKKERKWLCHLPSSCAWSPSFPQPHPPPQPSFWAPAKNYCVRILHNFAYSNGLLFLLLQERWSYYLCHVSVVIIIRNNGFIQHFHEVVLLFCCYEKFPVWHGRVCWLNKYLSQFLFFRCSLSGVSPFQGETVEETCRRITDVKYEFNPKHFDPISQQAKDFIAALLVKNPKWVKAHSKLFVFLSLFFLFLFLPFSRKLATLLVCRVHRTEIYAKGSWTGFLKFPFSFTELRFFLLASGIDPWRWPNGSKPCERECQISRWRGPH